MDGDRPVQERPRLPLHQVGRPSNSFGTITEIEFYAGNRKLTGTPFATTGAKNDPNNDAKRAFDGDVKTFYNGVDYFFQYVGIDLGEASQVAAPKFSVAPGSYATAQTVEVSCATPGGTPPPTSGLATSLPTMYTSADGKAS